MPTIHVQSSLRGEVGQQRAGLIGQALAAEGVVEAVAEAEETPRAGALHLRGERAQRRVGIVGWKELPEPREPARLFEVQIGNQQRFLARPEQRALSGREERFACERKGNHDSVIARSEATKQSKKSRAETQRCRDLLQLLCVLRVSA